MTAVSQRVLAPINPGDIAPAVVDRAVELVDPGGRLYLAYIADKSFMNQLPGAARAPDSTVEGMERIGRRVLERERERIEGGDFEIVVVVRHGELLEEIVDLVREYEIDTLVVGEHKREFIEAHEEHEWSHVQDATEARIEIVPVPED